MRMSKIPYFKFLQSVLQPQKNWDLPVTGISCSEDASDFCEGSRKKPCYYCQIASALSYQRSNYGRRCSLMGTRTNLWAEHSYHWNQFLCQMVPVGHLPLLDLVASLFFHPLEHQNWHWLKNIRRGEKHLETPTNHVKQDMNENRGLKKKE